MKYVLRIDAPAGSPSSGNPRKAEYLVFDSEESRRLKLEELQLAGMDAGRMSYFETEYTIKDGVLFDY